MFLPVSTRTGALRIRWSPVVTHECRIWLLLADPRSLGPDDLMPQRLLQHMIRLPVSGEAGEALVFAPTGRTCGLAVVWRDPEDAPQSMLPTTAEEVPLEPEAPAPVIAVPSTRSATLPQLTPAPTPREPFPFITPTPTPADAPAIAALAARLMAAAPVMPPAPPLPTGFGLQQQWYLARFSFLPIKPDAPRVVVRRSTFIHAADLATWAAIPPSDAVLLPAAADAIIDALSAPGETAFFTVLEGPAPWRPLPLCPLAPPFEGARAPFPLGDAASRLTLAMAAARDRGADPIVLEILTAASIGL